MIELMVVVAIIVAIAIPRYMRFQLKAKTAEGKVNLAAIRTSEAAYLSEFGVYVAAAALPTGSVTAVSQPWPANAGGFEVLGWKPEGNVYFEYGVASAVDSGFTASAIADLDRDGTRQAWGLFVPTGGGVRVSSVHSECDVSNIRTRSDPAPCDQLGAALFGNNVF